MNLRIKKITGFIAVVAIAMVIGGCSDTKIGVVDVDKVMSDSPKVQQFEEQLKNDAKTRVDQLEKEKATLSQEDLQKRSMEISGEMEKLKQDLSKQLNESMDKALDEIAKEKKMSVILYKNGVAQGGIDITDDVIKKMQ